MSYAASCKPEDTLAVRAGPHLRQRRANRPAGVRTTSRYRGCSCSIQGDAGAMYGPLACCRRRSRCRPRDDGPACDRLHCDVAFWPKADMTLCSANVRYWPKADMGALHMSAFRGKAGAPLSLNTLPNAFLGKKADHPDAEHQTESKPAHACVAQSSKELGSQPGTQQEWHCQGCSGDC